MMVEIIAAFIGTIAFSICFNIAKEELIYCGAVGGIGWFIYFITFNIIDDKVYSSFIAALVISIISHILSRIRKNPVTIYETGGILPLVPGAGMYRTLYFIIIEDYLQSNYYLYETLKIAGAMAVAMMLISSLNKLITSRSR